MQISKRYSLLIVTIILAFACKQKPQGLTLPESTVIKGSTTNMMANIERDISGKGPAAWLTYFDNSPDFYMASDGKVVFANYQSAQKFVLDTLVKIIPHIKLKWSGLKIEPLSKDLSFIGAGFNEDLTDAKGMIQHSGGYFTAIGRFDGKTWKLKNLHWSISH